jgi:glycosyltransferase involved in cell wall biosynthesis
MNVLFLTNNSQLGSTARILQSWLLLGRRDGLRGWVVTQRPGDLSAWLTAEAIPHRVDPMPWPDKRRPLPGLWHAWRMARWARRAGIEVIHCNEHDVYPFGLLLRRLMNRPLVCHVRFRLSRPFCEWAFGGARRQPDALLWTSQQQRDDAAAAIEGLVPADRQRVVHLGLDLATFGTLAAGRERTREAWGVRPDEVVLGTASALRPIKRIEDFIALVAGLAREDARVVGVIAGDAAPGEGAYREGLLRQIAATGLGRRLQWIGHAEPVEPFHHACDVFVSTSAYETFGNSVCEAMACRRPVAAYRGGSVQEVVGAAGRIVETGDLPSLAAAVRELVARPDLRAELGQRGRDRVAERFNPAESLRQLKHLYHSLLSGRA